MSGPQRISILIVDADPAYRKALNTYFSRYPNFDVKEAETIAEGFKYAVDWQPDIIISDHREGLLDGIELCRKVKGTPDISQTTFIILTIESSADLKVKAFERGVDDYIEKSIKPVVLTGKINAFLRMTQLRKDLKAEKERYAEMNVALERNFKELTAILLKIIDLRVPGAADRAEIAKHIAKKVCEYIKLEEDDLREKLIFGAQLHEIGKIGLPDSIVAKSLSTISFSERDMFAQYPAIGSLIISAISGFKSSSEAIYHQFENFDGTGTPDGLIGEEIPMGARVLRAVVFYEELCRAGLEREEVIREIRQSANKILDPAVATVLAEYIIENQNDFSMNKQKIRVEELEPGMVIAEDVYAVSGVKLLPKGVRLQEHMLQVLFERNNRDPIIGGVYIQKN